MIPEEHRVAWIDYAKGFCIVMVVMMHSTLGVEKAAGAESWVHYFVAFATPFRMPDFFMIAGLFLARTIDRPWHEFADKKVVHFAWFYVLWLTIQVAFKAPGIAADEGTAAVVHAYLVAFIDPLGTMWFIYLLPIVFVLVRMLKRVPWWVVWLAGAALEMAHIQTGWTLVDEFAARFVYFYSGYVFAPFIFRLSDTALANSRAAIAYLVPWALVDAGAVYAGVSAAPGVSLALGFAGAVAVVAFSALLSKSDLMAPLRYCGRQSLVIYLAFFLPMAASRTALLQSGVIADLGTISLLVTIAGVVVPLAMFQAVRNTPARFLFERPAWARLGAPKRAGIVPAE